VTLARGKDGGVMDDEQINALVHIARDALRLVVDDLARSCTLTSEIEQANNWPDPPLTKLAGYRAQYAQLQPLYVRLGVLA
jgi:hypothetical protein